MRLCALTIENFRAYQTETRIEFGDLTTIIGRNDVGKSTVLEALEIFFNNELVKVDPSDANVYGTSRTVALTAEFDDLPVELSLDAGALTSLRDEYLLAGNGHLVIRREYDCSKKTPTSETFIIAQHPTADGLDNLLELKEKELQALVKNDGLTASLKGNPNMRRALWGAASDLNLSEVRIPVSKAKEDTKKIWEKLEIHLPLFALFQSDRSSRDSDDEIQNPLRGAVAAAIAEAKTEIAEIELKVRRRAEEIAELTHAALKSIDPTLASTLSPKFIPPTPAKWSGLFSLGMDTHDAIPLNKRGSGVRRIILVSFFKAEAERKHADAGSGNIIYAVEEPETSQHPSNQKILVEALKDISLLPGTQVILTTHSPGLAAELPAEGIRYVDSSTRSSTPRIRQGVDVFGEVADALGLTPDSRVRLLLCVEGPHDVEALKHLSRALHLSNPEFPNLTEDPRCAFVVLGGSTLKHWVSNNYLKHLRLPEVHIYDNDVPKYGETVAEVNQRQDGLGSWAKLTSKHEIECYLHSAAIRDAFDVEVNVVDVPTAVFPSVPAAFGIAFAQKRGWPPLKENTAKKKLASGAFPKMTAAMLGERDPAGEVAGWMQEIRRLLER